MEMVKEAKRETEGMEVKKGLLFNLFVLAIKKKKWNPLLLINPTVTRTKKAWEGHFY